MFRNIIIITVFANYHFINVQTYRNFYTLLNLNLLNVVDDPCERFFVTTNATPVEDRLHKLKKNVTVRPKIIDPLTKYEQMVDVFLYGNTNTAATFGYPITAPKKVKLTMGRQKGVLMQLVTGNLMHAELFDGAPQVHMPDSDLIQRGHVKLGVTKDYLQTAVNAFFIFIYGDILDVLRLPPRYTLNSARTIAMMKLSQEKLSAVWQVVKNQTDPATISYETLCKFRPLFKYVSAKEMARLNLTDPRILSYIGTHPDLDRHQVGVIASRYIKLNPNWSQTKYLNLMNNLICGVPITYMRKINENTYLQLDHQVFFHTRACDPLQRRFFLAMMTKTQALGKSYSWSARDVTRLGLLLAEVKGKDLSAINPEAMLGISAQVMMEMDPENLQHITDMQMKYLEQKTLNIMSRKLKHFFDRKRSNDVRTPLPSYFFFLFVLNINKVLL